MTKVTETTLEIPVEADADMFAEAAHEAPAGPIEEAVAVRADLAPAPVPRPSRMPIVAAGIAMFAAAASLGSVVIAGQATARAGVLLEQAEADHRQLAGLPKLVERFEAATRTLEAQAATHPATDATLRAALSDLRQDLARSNAAASTAVPALRGAQNELANRLAIAIEKLNRIDEKVGRR